MEYPVIVRAEESDGYVAQPIGLPELRVTAVSEDEAIAGVRQALERWLASAKLVHVSVSVAGTDNPGSTHSDDPRLIRISRSIWTLVSRKIGLL